MADSYFLAGLAANACIQAWSVTVTNEHALADFQKAKLQNGRPWEPFISGATVANWEAVFDTNMITDADFELNAAAAAPGGDWVVESGTPVITTAQSHTGTKSLEFNAASEVAYQDRVCVPGNTYRFEIALYGDGTNTIEVELIDLRTGKYKTNVSDSSWATTATSLFTKTTTGFANNTRTLVIESAPDGNLGATTLRARIKKVGTGTAYADLALLYMKVDFASLHDFNYHDQIDVEVRSSNNNFGGDDDDEGSLPVRRMRTYLAFTPTSATPKRWRKFRFNGTPFDPIRLGQPFMGERKVFNSALYGASFSRVMPQTGIQTDVVRVPTNQAQDARYAYELQYRHTETQLRQVVEQLRNASGHGGEPVVLVPEITKYEVIHGRVAAEHSWQRPSQLHEHTLTIEEDPFVVMTK